MGPAMTEGARARAGDGQFGGGAGGCARASPGRRCGCGRRKSAKSPNDPVRGCVGRPGVVLGLHLAGEVGGKRKSPKSRNDPVRGAAGARAVAAAGQTPGSSNDPVGGTRGQTRETRNDPIGGSAVWVRAAGAPLNTRVVVLAERRAGETTEWAPGSPVLRGDLVREVGKQQLRAEVGLRGNDPVRGLAAGAGQGGGGPVVLAAGTEVGSTRGLAISSTTLARMLEPRLAALLAARFGPAAVVPDWWRAQVAPPAIAAMHGGGVRNDPVRRRLSRGRTMGVAGGASVSGMRVVRAVPCAVPSPSSLRALTSPTKRGRGARLAGPGPARSLRWWCLFGAVGNGLATIPGQNRNCRRQAGIVGPLPRRAWLCDEVSNTRPEQRRGSTCPIVPPPKAP